MHVPTSAPGAIQQIDILWITAGLGCDGDTIALTAATQPTLEELLLGGIPGIPTVKFHNPFLSIENGDEFMELFHRAARGDLEPFMLNGTRRRWKTLVYSWSSL